MKPGERIRVLRIAHSSLTPALRKRERALSLGYTDLDLRVLTVERWREAEVEVEAADDDLFPVAKSRTYLSNHIQLFAYDPRTIIRALREHRPHLVDVGHEPYSVACAEALALCAQFAPQAVTILQTNQNILRNYPPPFNWLERRAFRKVSAAYGCSMSVCEVIRAKGFQKPAPIIPFGVDIHDFQPRPRTNERRHQALTVSFVGRLLPEKGLNVLAQALIKLKNRKWNLLVIGDGPERSAFERRLAELGLSNRAKFTGAVPYERVPTLFRDIGVLVLPTQTTTRVREQFGRVLAEAMACGLPVIGSTSGAIPEVIGDAGVVFEQGNVDALANALSGVLSDERLREQLSKAGRARVEKYYSWERVAEKMYNLFLEVIMNQRALKTAQFDRALLRTNLNAET